MNCQERILKALNCEEPDRVPCHLILIDANNVDKILEKPEMTDFDIVDQIKENNPGNWAEELTNLVESVETQVFSRCVQAAVEIGLDCMQVGIIPLYFIDDNKDDRLLMKDIFGRVWEARNNEGNFNPYYLYGTMDSIDKWTHIKNELRESLKTKYKKFVKKFYRRINKKFKDDICVAVTNDLAGVFESASQGMGMTYYAKMLHRNPSFIKQVHMEYAEFTAELYKSYMEVGARVFVESGDLAYKTGPMMSPKKYYDLLLPAYQKITDTVHENGGKIILHSDGQITPLLDFIIDCGFDGLHSLEPTAGVDLAYVKKKVNGKLCLVGNIDVSHTLVKGTKKAVYAEVKRAIKDGSSGGGLIISAANMHPDVKVENLKWMVEATKEFGEYPIDF